MSNKYKITELVTNVPDVGKFSDVYLCGPSAIVTDSQKNIWIANNGDTQSVNKNVSHYDLYGVRLSENLPFIDYVSPDPLVPPSLQRQTLTDLFWLQKNVLYYRNKKIVAMPRFYNFPPIIGTVRRQPSPEEIALDKFLNKPNGYLGRYFNVSYLVNFCVNKPNPLKTPAGKRATTLLSNAHVIYRKLILNLFNSSLIFQYGSKLSEAQRWLIISGQVPQKEDPTPTEPKDGILKMVDHHNQRVGAVEVVTNAINDQLPIGLVYNWSRGFVGYEFNNARVSCDLLAAAPNGNIYVYSPLIQTGIYYGFVTAIDNSASYSVYTGIAMSSNNIYVANLSNRRIDMFDFGWVANRDLIFVDPDLPEDYSPYNVFNYKDQIIVLYAKIDTTSGPYIDKVTYGKGYGIINVFSSSGQLIKRAVTNGYLNAPWGITIVKHYFAHGKYIIANHGDGRILIYDKHWSLVNRIRYKNYEKSLAGLYGVCSVYEDVYFTSGANGIVNGLYGEIKKPHHGSPCPPHPPCNSKQNNPPHARTQPHPPVTIPTVLTTSLDWYHGHTGLPHLIKTKQIVQKSGPPPPKIPPKVVPFRPKITQPQPKEAPKGSEDSKSSSGSDTGSIFSQMSD
uniref:Uncharacterized protein n=1 Tax=viral metagenome TaxID=1070528 RepID=A0A6C0BKC2_9ZZZZ